MSEPLHDLHGIDCATRLALGETVEVVGMRRLEDGGYRCYLIDRELGVYADVDSSDGADALWRCFTREEACCTIPMPPNEAIGLDEEWEPVL